jgi:hypothetical protein
MMKPEAASFRFVKRVAEFMPVATPGERLREGGRLNRGKFQNGTIGWTSGEGYTPCFLVRVAGKGLTRRGGVRARDAGVSCEICEGKTKGGGKVV